MEQSDRKMNVILVRADSSQQRIQLYASEIYSNGIIKYEGDYYVMRRLTASGVVYEVESVIDL